MGRLIAKVWFESIQARVWMSVRRPWRWVVPLPSLEELERHRDYTYRVYRIPAK